MPTYYAKSEYKIFFKFRSVIADDPQYADIRNEIISRLDKLSCSPTIGIDVCGTGASTGHAIGGIPGNFTGTVTSSRSNGLFSVSFDGWIKINCSGPDAQEIYEPARKGQKLLCIKSLEADTNRPGTRLAMQLTDDAGDEINESPMIATLSKKKPEDLSFF